MNTHSISFSVILGERHHHQLHSLKKFIYILILPIEIIVEAIFPSMQAMLLTFYHFFIAYSIMDNQDTVLLS